MYFTHVCLKRGIPSLDPEVSSIFILSKGFLGKGSSLSMPYVEQIINQTMSSVILGCIQNVDLTVLFKHISV